MTRLRVGDGWQILRNFFPQVSCLRRSYFSCNCKRTLRTAVLFPFENVEGSVDTAKCGSDANGYCTDRNLLRNVDHYVMAFYLGNHPCVMRDALETSQTEIVRKLVLSGVCLAFARKPTQRDA